MTEPVSVSLGCDYDLSEHEPQWVSEEDGLRIEAYDIDGNLVLNVDWAPGGKWDHLEDQGLFAEMVRTLVEGLTESEVVLVPADAADAPSANEEAPAGAGCSLAGAEESVDLGSCGCPIAG